MEDNNNRGKKTFDKRWKWGIMLKRFRAGKCGEKKRKKTY